MNYPLNNIYFYLTEGCNLRCSHCWINPKYQTPDRKYDSLDFDLFRRIIKEAKPLGLKAVKLTGGEPLIHPDIFRILRFIRKEEIGVTIETNGTCCTPELAKEIKKCRHQNVSVSIDGSDAATHDRIRGVEGSFDLAIEGIKNLVNAGFRPQVIMSVMGINKNQMEGVTGMAKSLGAGSVKFNIVMPTARGERMHEAGETVGIKELITLGKWVETVLSKKTGIRVHYSHPYAYVPLGRLYEQRVRGQCNILNILGVLSDGSYALCGIGEHVSDLVFGQAGKDSLNDIWLNTEMLRDLREGLPGKLEGICSNCIMSQMCMGSCIALNYYRNKSLWSPFWFCEEAEIAELFPEYRKKNEIERS